MSDSIKVKIISGFDATGVREAQSGLARVTASTSGLSTANKLSQEAAKRTAEEMGKKAARMRQAAAAGAALSAALGNGSGGLAVVMRGLGAVVGGIVSGPMGLLTLGVTAIGGTIALLSKITADNKRKMAEMRAEYEKSKAAFQQGIENTLRARVEALGNSYGTLADKIAAAGAAAQAIRGAMTGLSTAETRFQTAAVDAETQTAMSGAETPQDKKVIELTGQLKRLQIENRAALDAAQVTKSNAAADITRAQQVADAQKQYVAELQDEVNTLQATGKDKLAHEASKKLTEAREKLAKDIAAIRPLEFALAEATMEIETVRIQTAMRENDAVNALENYKLKIQRAAAAKEELGAKESELASQTADLAIATREEAKARDAAARAQSRADAAAKGPLHQFVADQKAKADQQKEDANEERKFKRKVEELKRRRDRGVKLSENDRQTLDFAEQRGRAVEQNELASKNYTERANLLAREGAERQEETNTLLKEIKDLLSRDLQVN